MGSGCEVLERVGYVLCVSWLFFRVNMPDYVVWKAVDFVACAFGHFGEAFCFSLVLKGITRKVDA